MLARRWPQRLLIAVLLAVCCLGVAFELHAEADHETPTALLEAHFIDVGQGDCILVRLPDGRSMLIDAGERQYGRSIVQYLQGVGVQRIDYLIATHPHADHIGGLPDVIEAFPIGAVYMPRTTHTTQTYQRLLEAIRNKGLRITEAVAGQTLFDHDSLTAKLVAPQRNQYSNLNDYSAVVRLVYGSTAFLFTGDAERTSEDEMLGSGQPLRADVLKVGHHGSRTSSSARFLDAVSPSIAVIQVGADNRYGHPAEEVLARLAGVGATVYRNDLHGTVIVYSDGASVRAATGGRDLPHAARSPQADQVARDAEPSQPRQEYRPAPSQTVDDTVYLTPTGGRYHREGCRTIRGQSRAVTRQEAKGKGFDACGVCKP